MLFSDGEDDISFYHRSRTDPGMLLGVQDSEPRVSTVNML